MANGTSAINALKGAADALHLADMGKMLKKGYKYGTANNGQYKDGFKQATNEVFFNGKGISMDNADYAAIAGGAVGGMIGLRAGMGALRGTFTDSNGNLDLPGIPFI